jgi:hypothetical protein
MKRVNRFWELKKFIDFEKISDITIDNETTLPHDRGPGKVNGYYEILNSSLVAVFSIDNKNYLLFIDRQIELTKNISIRYDIAQEMNNISWFKIYDGEKLIFEIEYVNLHEPLTSPEGFPYDVDFYYTNFGYKLAEYLEKVQQNPGIVLFPGVVK